MAQRALPVLERRKFGETYRRDAWWLPNIPTVVILSAFLIYGTWAAFQGDFYTHGPYLSPFYSPEIWGISDHAWFGPRPPFWPSWLVFSPALVILPFPALFRFTCYYYRGAYYKAFWQDPPACSVGEPRNEYWGEQKGPMRLQNLHRWVLYPALFILLVLAYDAWKAFWFTDPVTGQTEFGIGVGTLVLLANVILLSGYTLGCHAMRHIVGGKLDQLSLHRVRAAMYDLSTRLNVGHMRWAWASLLMVGFADIYVRLCAMGVINDLRLL